MERNNVRIRVSVSGNEAEIEAPIEELEKIIKLIPSLVNNLPQAEEVKKYVAVKEEVKREEAKKEEKEGIEELPSIRINKKDSLTDVITKMFSQPWGRKPRKLGDVRKVLESYGLIYPKQSVAVALLRLAQSGKLRRFRGDEKEFVYTASQTLAFKPNFEEVET
jgi:hypothetical protein